VGAVHALDPDGERLSLQRRQERLALLLRCLHRGRGRCLEVADGSSDEAIAKYKKVSDELLDATFLAEIAINWEQWATSERLQGAGYTKRSELLLTDAWLTTA
jgi:hypothetical protein